MNVRFGPGPPVPPRPFNWLAQYPNLLLCIALLILGGQL